jgi:hypothetical protein
VLRFLPSLRKEFFRLAVSHFLTLSYLSGAEGVRTPDLLNAIHRLTHLQFVNYTTLLYGRKRSYVNASKAVSAAKICPI